MILFLWATEQRKNSRYGRLSQQRIEQLNGIGFNWEEEAYRPHIPKETRETTREAVREATRETTREVKEKETAILTPDGSPNSAYIDNGELLSDEDDDDEKGSPNKLKKRSKIERNIFIHTF